MTWAGDLEWTADSRYLRRGSSNSVQSDQRRARVLGTRKVFKSVELADKGVSLKAPDKGTKSLFILISLEYVGKRNGSPLRVPMRGEG